MLIQFYCTNKLTNILNMFYLSRFQVTSALAPLWFDIRGTCPSQLEGHGLQHRTALRHVDLRHHQHSLLQVENEQGSWFHHVPALLCLRRRQPGPRVWLPTLP